MARSSWLDVLRLGYLGRRDFAEAVDADGRVLVTERDERHEGLAGIRSVHNDLSTRPPAGLFRETVGSACGEGAIAASRVCRADRGGGRGRPDGAPGPGGGGGRRAGG